MKRMWSKNELKNQVQEAVSSGSLKNVKVFENIVDKDGHKRFIKGDIVEATITGVTFNYDKWSLSGSHLLIVLSGTIVSGTTIASESVLGTIEDLPEWVFEKIKPLFATKYVIQKSVVTFSDDFTTGTITVVLSKETNHLAISNTTALSVNKNRSFRIEFDLLIDNE